MGRVLVVDDEIDICSLLTQQLQKLGFQTAYSLTIRDAILNLRATSYDIIFVDLNLTDGSGYDLISSLRSMDTRAKVIVISAYDSERHKVLESGANFFVAKPFTKNSIKDALKKLNFLNN